ncbi:alpha/beta fold hydrolase [Pseudonocardia sp. TRM90224]|uniref:alpha/beta fold hydrolase n=1 Tax=Pseudonocardia sp. TRM90224 TaxID=2812678 RepID=UPI001E62BBF7|nr:alpha/beta hydrolase [Pseudonocardia sp. TRM90224]
MHTETFRNGGNEVRWSRWGTGPAVVLCHGTPWSAALWAPIAAALSAEFTVHLWDMPGYGSSTKADGQDVSLGMQSELFPALLAEWGLDAPHVVAHDFGGAVALRAHLLHGATYSSLALVDVVALAPWGSDFFRLVRDNAEVFMQLPGFLHEALVREYVRGAAARELTTDDERMLVDPWLGAVGQAAFYRQIAQADQRFTDEIEPLYPTIDMPVAVVWGAHDTWIPVDRAERLASIIPGAELHVVPGANHLIQLDAPAALTAVLQRWLQAAARR